jgi:hypothetical protein
MSFFVVMWFLKHRPMACFGQTVPEHAAGDVDAGRHFKNKTYKKNLNRSKQPSVKQIPPFWESIMQGFHFHQVQRRQSEPIHDTAIIS